MSLQVWLPLNGNLNNQGISDAAITNNGATINASGKIGQCYSFDGTDDYLQTINFDMDNWPEYSIAAWIKPTISSFYLFLVRSGGTHQIRISNDCLMFRDNNNSSQRTVSFNHSFVENQWIHICCVYNRGEIFMYCDGVQTNHSTSYYHANSFTNTGNTEVRIGRSQSSSGNSYYSGFINDFRIYDHALSAKEAEELAKGLTFHYKLDGALGLDNILYDSSGYQHNGDIVGNVTFFDSTPRYDMSAHFIQGSYIRTKERPVICLPTDAITVNIWVRIDTWGNPVSCTQSGGWNFENSSGIEFPVYISGVGYKVANSGVTLATLGNSWHMLTGTFDKENVKIYIDGVLKTTTATGTTNPIGYANNYLFVGAEAAANTTTPADSNFVGELSDLRIYCTALTEDQIKELYDTSATIDKNGNVYAREVIE